MVSCLAFGAGQIQAILGFLSDVPSHSFVFCCAPITFHLLPIPLSSHTLGISSHILATASFAFLLSHLHSLSHFLAFLSLSWHSFAFYGLLALPSLYKKLARSTGIDSGVLPSFPSPSTSLSCPTPLPSIPILSLASLSLPWCLYLHPIFDPIALITLQPPSATT